MKKILVLFLGVVIACKPKSNDAPIIIENKNSVIDSLSHIKKNEITGFEAIKGSFKVYWNKFINSIQHSNYDAFQELSLDYIYYNHSKINMDVFIKKHFEKAFDKELLSFLSNRNNIAFSPFESDGSCPPETPDQLRNTRGNYFVQEAYITKELNKESIYGEVKLRFVETIKGFRFFEFSYLEKSSAPGFR